MCTSRSERENGDLGGKTFPAFPYEPYDIQKSFMASIYATLDTGGIGLFESPTGTGKTLSLICSVLQWLEDTQSQENQAPDADSDGPELPAWLAAPTDNCSRPDKPSLKIPTSDDKRNCIRHKQASHLPSSASIKPEAAGQGSDNSGAEHLLDIWVSDSDEPSVSSKHRMPNAAVPSSSDSEDDGVAKSWKFNPENSKPKQRQVFYCSRTHSQLSQFISELQRTSLADTVATVALASRKALCVNDSVLKLGALSRINERCLEMLQGKSTKKQATGQPNKQKAIKVGGSCPFMKAKAKAKNNFQEAILAQPVDVEELGKQGRRKGVCPYYTARSAVPEAQLVLLPYSALLAQDSRESLGLHLKGSVVVVDEAHNLVDAVNSAHCAEVSAQQLTAAEAQLSTYFERFRTRLAAGNSRHIQALIGLACALRRTVEQPVPGQQRIQRVNDFLFDNGLDGVNMFKLLRYVKESKVLFKVAGYADAAQQQADVGCVQRHSTPAAAGQSGGQMNALHALVGFIAGLNNADADGRILLDPAAATLKFLLLNAAAHFSKVVQQAHAVVLASGTLSPIASLTRQLFPTLAPSSINHFSCGHVVPRDRLLALAVPQGPSGASLQLKHDQRGSHSSLDEVGRLLLNICSCTPQGVVAFCPSFAHCDQLYTRWSHTGLLTQLSTKKEVFREPRAASEVDSMLQRYAECITRASQPLTQKPADVPQAARASTAPESLTQDTIEDSSSGSSSSSKCTGALMLCVVGGKLCEGINFSDGFGRCVVMVGMPYPNPTDPELQERMRFMDEQQQHQALRPSAARTATELAAYEGQAPYVHESERTAPAAADHMTSRNKASQSMSHQSEGKALTAGREYYEDLCMKAVNQCVGRVIRHRNDYAAIVLADARWCSGNCGVMQASSDSLSGPLKKLPEWIQGSLTVCKSFGDAYGRLHRFHRQMLTASTSKGYH